jgi:hypothetical protein
MLSCGLILQLRRGGKLPSSHAVNKYGDTHTVYPDRLILPDVIIFCRNTEGKALYSRRHTNTKTLKKLCILKKYMYGHDTIIWLEAVLDKPVMSGHTNWLGRYSAFRNLSFNFRGRDTKTPEWTSLCVFSVPANAFNDSFHILSNSLLFDTTGRSKILCTRDGYSTKTGKLF